MGMGKGKFGIARSGPVRSLYDNINGNINRLNQTGMRARHKPHGSPLLHKEDEDAQAAVCKALMESHSTQFSASFQSICN